MTFDPKKSKIAITVPRFTLKKNADRGLFTTRYNEPYMLSAAVDAHGAADPRIDFNFMPFPKVQPGDSVEMMADGHLVYGPKNPGEFVALSILIMESDKDIRKIGEVIEKAVKSEAEKLGLAAVLKSNPGAAGVLGVLKEVFQFVAGTLKNKGDDELFRYAGTFLRDHPSPYHINRRYVSANDYAEVAVQVIPLQSPNGQGAAIKGLGV